MIVSPVRTLISIAVIIKYARVHHVYVEPRRVRRLCNFDRLIIIIAQKRRKAWENISNNGKRREISINSRDEDSFSRRSVCIGILERRGRVAREIKEGDNEFLSFFPTRKKEF